jgi:hypothetical protein
MSSDITSSVTSFAIVRFEVVGFHRWPGASEERAYLAQRHRHKFFVEARVQVYHDDREIEFHDLQDFCKTVFTFGHEAGEFGGSSCEALARILLTEIARAYGSERAIRVSVFEDNEVGAEVVFTPGGQ